MSVQETTQVEQPQGEQTTEQTPVVKTESSEQTEAQGQEQPVEVPAEEGQQTERDDKGRFKGVQPRIDELTRARREAEREASYWRGIAQQGQAQTSAQAAPTKPTVADFADYGEYVEALAEWTAEQAVAKRMEQDSTRKVAETRTQTFTERQAAVRALMPDYDTVVGGSDAPISEHVGDALKDSERGPELAYHFAKNPDVLLRLNSMGQRQADREIGKLEATLPVLKAPAVPSPKLSTTPAPASTVNTQGRTTKPALATASMEEYMAQRKAQGARWAR